MTSGGGALSTQSAAAFSVLASFSRDSSISGGLQLDNRSLLYLTWHVRKDLDRRSPGSDRVRSGQTVKTGEVEEALFKRHLSG